jgi:hypothetical protein
LPSPDSSATLFKNADDFVKVKIDSYCHAELVEVCRDIDDLHSPFDKLRVNAVTFYEVVKIRG